MKRKRRVLALLCLAVGCADGAGPSKATATSLRVVLTSRSVDDGGILFRIEGPFIDSVTASSGRVFAERDGNALVVLIAGTVRAGVVARLWGSAEQPATAYQATVIQVAGGPASTQRELTGYALRVE